MKPIDWLLGHLDQPGVSEIVVGVGRPVSVREDDAYRPITSMSFDRADIETLVAGTPMSNLIGAPASLPPVEIEVESRRVIVEVVRQGYDSALRISNVPTRGSGTTPPRTKTVTAATGTIAPPTRPLIETRRAPTKPPAEDAPARSSASMTPLAEPARAATPTAPTEVAARAPTPAPPRVDARSGTVASDEAPFVPARFTSPTAAPRNAPAVAPPSDDAPFVPARFTSPTAAPRNAPAVDAAPIADAPARFTSPTLPPRTSTTSTLPVDDAPFMAARFTSPTAAPRPATSTNVPFIDGVPVVPSEPIGTGRIPRTAASTSSPPVEVEPAPIEMFDAMLPDEGGRGEVEEADEPSYEQDLGGEVYAPEWYGPQIIDEDADITPLHALLEAAYRQNASDLHIIAKQPVTIRRLGKLTALQAEALVEPFDRSLYSALFGPLDSMLCARFLMPLLGPSAQHKLAEVGYVDIGFRVPDRGRIRANISQQKDGLAGSFRLCRSSIPTLVGLGLPLELEKAVRHHQGLVVVAGPSGHGKTTTMAALVDLLNTSNTDHIITIEDPVEIEHPPKRAIVSHREVGRHTLSFISALKASLREDPDVIVIGELRDRETVEIALAAAETGHLVLSTISTPSAVKTIDRLIDMFPPDDQVQVRASISGTLRAVIAQRLVPNAANDDMVAAIELVTGVLPLATMIRDNKLFQLPSLMQRGRAFGMLRLDDSLAELVRAKRITEEVALGAAENRRELSAILAGRATGQTNAKNLFGGKAPK